MFKFLKDTVSKLSRSIEEEVPDDISEQAEEGKASETNPEGIDEDKHAVEKQETAETTADSHEDSSDKTHAEDTDECINKDTMLTEDPQQASDKDDRSENKEQTDDSGNEGSGKKGFLSRIFGKKELTEEEIEKTEEKLEEAIEGKSDVAEETDKEAADASEPAKEGSESEQKKGLFSGLTKAITTKKISEEKFEELFWDLELALLENNTAVEVIEKIKSDLKKSIVDVPIKRSQITATIMESLKRSLKEILSVDSFDFVERVKQKKPFVICFVGVNGSGKTTSIAKIAYLLKKNDLEPVLAAGDTFRAAAIDQLEEHAVNLDVKIIKHDYGSDAAAVAFDAIGHAKSKGKDVVLIDTAGRLHSNSNLMDELRKVIKVSEPDMILFVGESITGNDCVEQARKFNESIGIDGIILSKADIDEKGGAAISVEYVTKKPILFIGTGQEYEDIEKFSADKILKSLGLEE